MPVKCLGPNEKDYILENFHAKTYTINSLAYIFKVSRRTIIRVLEEGGIDPGIRRRKPASPEQTKLDPLIFPDHMINPNNIPWYQRFWKNLCQIFDPCPYAESVYK